MHFLWPEILLADHYNIQIVDGIVKGLGFGFLSDASSYFLSGELVRLT